MNSGRRLASVRSGFAMVEIMVVLIIITALAALYFGTRGKREEAEPEFEGQAQTTLGKAVQKAESVECRNNLSQLRQMIQMESMEGSNPGQLDADWGVLLRCPVSGYEYRYDPESGRVWCPTPGHQEY